MFSNIWTKALSYLAPIGIALSILLGAYLRGKSDQKGAQTKQELDTLRKGNKIDEKVIQMSPSELDSNINRWMRD